MEFRFDVRSILLDEISKVDNTLIIKGWSSKTRFRVEYQQLYEIINAIGEASSFAQGLSNVITTAEKLQNSDHLLYLMKEDDPTSRASVVVGMLKVGRKKLFVLDQEQQTKEVAPLCVLDFYVHESRQRRGYGRRLFDYMLQEQNVDAGHMAVDKPSDKFLGFLKKHYYLDSKVPQINNFVVYTSFFDEERPVTQDEAQMTAVNRSRGGSRAGSRTGSRAGSRTGSRGGSPELPATPNSTSPSSSRRLSNANPSSNPAGRPTYGPRHSSICVSNGIQFATFHPNYPINGGPPPYRPPLPQADILHGRSDRHTPAAHKNPRYQPTLEWMKTEGGGTPHYSRSPSNAGSPISRTPHASSPPATPPRAAAGADHRDTRLSAEGSIAPTPATSPRRGASPTPPEEPVEEVEVEEEAAEANGVVEGQVEELVQESRNSSLAASPPHSPGKTGSWRDSISRNSEGLIKHLANPESEGTSAGVLKDNESVHGHLKFHHHKLW